MTTSLNSLKQILINDRLIPSAYTFLSRPFANKLRHLPSAPAPIPKAKEKVSVVIPNYNYKSFLDERINSILAQTYPIYELIILDDASTDGSGEYIEKELLPEIRTKNPDLKVSFFKNKNNSGKSLLQWQKAFKKASGDYLWIAEADDLSDSNFLTQTMQKFKDDESVILSFSNSVAINSSGKILTYDFANRSSDKLKSRRFRNDFIISGEEVIKTNFAVNCIIPNVSACVFRLNNKIPYKTLLVSSTSFTQCGDWNFYLELLAYGSLAFSCASLNYFRIHSRSVTANSKKSKIFEKEVRSIHEKLSSKYALSPEILAAQTRELSRIIAR